MVGECCCNCRHGACNTFKEPCWIDSGLGCGHCWKLGYPNYEPKATPPGNSAREDERTCRMLKTPLFHVVLVDEPTVQEAREKSKIGVIVYSQVITARDKEAAIAKAMAELCGMEEPPPFNPDMVAATVIPFGQ